MKIEVDKKDLENMIKGVEPSYDVMDMLCFKGLGSYVGGHSDKWVWSYIFPTDLTLQELYDIYLSIKS